MACKQSTTANVTTDWSDDYEDLARYVAAHPDGKVSVATTSISGTSLQDVGYGIAWAADDSGRIHYAVTDGTDWPEYAATVEEAFATATSWAVAAVDPRYPVDIAYDLNIPALSHGDKGDLLARIPTN